MNDRVDNSISSLSLSLSSIFFKMICSYFLKYPSNKSSTFFLSNKESLPRLKRLFALYLLNVINIAKIENSGEYGYICRDAYSTMQLKIYIPGIWKGSPSSSASNRKLKASKDLSSAGLPPK